MAGIINSSSFAKALFPGVSAWWGKSYDEFPVEVEDLFETYSSSRAYEEDVGVTSFGLAKIKPEGQGIQYDDESQAFITRYSHTVYALGFVITREMYEDDLYEVAAQRRAQGLAFSMRQTKETVGANVYNRAFDGAYVGGDGVSLVNAAHPNFAGGTQSNSLATPADLSEASLEEACIDVQKWTNDRGLRISVVPSSLHIHVDDMFEAERILQSPYRVGTNNNDINALYAMGKFPGGVKVNHYFTDENAWFLRTNVKEGMKMYQRRGTEFTIDNDFDTENAKYKASERYSFGWTDWRGIYGSEGV
jgi:hypothetical protein